MVHDVGDPSILVRYPALAILPRWPFIHRTSASRDTFDLGIAACRISTAVHLPALLTALKIESQVVPILAGLSRRIWSFNVPYQPMSTAVALAVDKAPGTAVARSLRLTLSRFR